jgi:holo-ACP synthase CitX
MERDRRADPADLADSRRAVLAARDARQGRCDSFLARAGGSGCVVAVSTVIPGADKRPAGADLLVRAVSAALQALGSMTSSSPTEHGEDVLGEFLLFADGADGRRMKERCVGLESTLPWGRLIDLDVYDAEGHPVTRHGLGLPERTCLVCDEPARDCMRLGRHDEAELRARVETLLGSLRAGEDGDHDERPRSV